MKFPKYKKTKTNYYTKNIEISQSKISKKYKMLRQRPSNVNNQSSLFIKKQKKRSTSTSRNKENISISHN